MSLLSALLELESQRYPSNWKTQEDSVLSKSMIFLSHPFQWSFTKMTLHREKENNQTFKELPDPGSELTLIPGDSKVHSGLPVRNEATRVRGPAEWLVRSTSRWL